MALTEQERHEVCDVVMATLIDLWKAHIDEGEQGDVAARDTVALAALRWMLVSKSSAAVARDDPAYGAMVFYERTRLGLTGSFFLDAVPTRLALFGAPTKLEFPAAQLSELLFDDVLSDRVNALEKIEQATPGSERRAKLVATLDGLPDVSPDIPVPARLFLSRARSICAGLREAQPAQRFRQCEHARCHRLFYAGDAAAWAPTMEPVAPLPVPLANRSYWERCCAAPLYNADNAHRFCSRACAHGWHAQWLRAFASDEVEWDADARVRSREHTNRDSRIATSLDRALERNGRVNRLCRKKRRALRRSALSTTDVERELAARVDMANVDAALLYAASIFSRLPCRRTSLTLPGERRGWRDGDVRIAVTRIAQLYRSQRERRAISTANSGFLRAVRSKIMTIF